MWNQKIEEKILQQQEELTELIRLRTQLEEFVGNAESNEDTTTTLQVRASIKRGIRCIKEAENIFNTLIPSADEVF